MSLRRGAVCSVGELTERLKDSAWRVRSLCFLQKVVAAVVVGVCQELKRLCDKQASVVRRSRVSRLLSVSVSLSFAAEYAPDIRCCVEFISVPDLAFNLYEVLRVCATLVRAFKNSRTSAR